MTVPQRLRPRASKASGPRCAALPPWGGPGQVNSLSSSIKGHPNGTNLTWVCGEQKRVKKGKGLAQHLAPQ